MSMASGKPQGHGSGGDPSDRLSGHARLVASSLWWGTLGFVEQAFSAPTEADHDHLYRVVADLGTYPDWLEVVNQAEPAVPAPDRPDEVAWTITLRAQLGPLARSKRLRMVRTVDDGRTVRFERRELDDRQHSSWVLSAEVSPLGEGSWRSQVTVDLRYGGSLWSGLLDAVLEHAAEDATERLQAYVAAPA